MITNLYQGHSDPALEGTTVSFSCPPELVLVGPNASVCTRNGVWDPDPREVACKGTTIMVLIIMLFYKYICTVYT